MVDLNPTISIITLTADGFKGTTWKEMVSGAISGSTLWFPGQYILPVGYKVSYNGLFT